MASRIEIAKRWPRTRNRQIVFKTTHEALFYANLIYDDKPLLDEIENSLRAARKQLTIMRQRNDPNLDILMQIAVKTQFFRECLEEAMRIMVEEK